MKAYLSTAEAAEFISARTQEAARKILADLGVTPIDFGPGRGRGLRWPKDEIVIAMDKRRFGKAAPKTPRQGVEWTVQAVLQAVHGRPQN